MQEDTFRPSRPGSVHANLYYYYYHYYCESESLWSCHLLLLTTAGRTEFEMPVAGGSMATTKNDNLSGFRGTSK